MNYGFKPEPLRPEDHVLGGTLGAAFPEINQTANWVAWLPSEEVQRINGVEPQSCVSFATSNVIETLARFTFDQTRNFSDRYIAKVSNTDIKGGNAPQAVAQAIRDNGAPNELDWPYTVTTLKDYYLPIPSWVKRLALAFTAEFEFRYKYVPATYDAIKQALKCSPVTFSVYAWEEKNGLYVRPEGARDNHCVMVYGYTEGEYWHVFDSYSNDGTVLKRLDWNALPEVCYVYSLARQVRNEQSWIGFLVTLVKAAFGL